MGNKSMARLLCVDTISQARYSTANLVKESTHDAPFLLPIAFAVLLSWYAPCFAQLAPGAAA